MVVVYYAKNSRTISGEYFPDGAAIYRSLYQELVSQRPGTLPSPEVLIQGSSDLEQVVGPTHLAVHHRSKSVTCSIHTTPQVVHLEDGVVLMELKMTLTLAPFGIQTRIPLQRESSISNSCACHHPRQQPVSIAEFGDYLYYLSLGMP